MNRELTCASLKLQMLDLTLKAWTVKVTVAACLLSILFILSTKVELQLINNVFDFPNFRLFTWSDHKP